MTAVLLLKLRYGLLLALAAAPLCFGLPWLVGALLTRSAMSTVPVVYTFCVIVTAVVMLVHVATFTGPNLAWMMSLPASKRRLWAASYVSALGSWLAALVSVASAAFMLDDVFPGNPRGSRLHLGEVYVSLYESGADFLRLLRFGRDVEPTDALPFVALIAALHHVSAMLDFKPSRSIGRSVLVGLAGVGLLFLAGMTVSSPAVIIGVLTVIALTFEIGHMRHRLEMTWRQAVPVAGFLVAAALLLAGLPLASAVRGLQSPRGDVFLDSAEVLGPLARPDEAHIVALLHAGVGDAWEFDRIHDHLARATGRGQIDPDDAAPLDFARLVAAQREPEVLLAIAEKLDTGKARTEHLLRIAELLDQRQVEPDGDLALRLTAVAIELPDAQAGLSAWLASSRSFVRRVGIVAARYFPGREAYALVAGTLRTRPVRDEGERDATLLTLSVMAGREIDAREAARHAGGEALPDIVPAAACEALARRRAAFCAGVRRCRERPGAAALECLFRETEGPGVINACLRTLTEGIGDRYWRGRRVTQIEPLGWIGPRSDDKALIWIDELLSCGAEP